MNRAALAQLLTDIVPTAPQQEFAAGGQLFQQEAPSRGCYVIQRGLVELTLSCHDGTELVVERAGAGSLVGLSASFGERYIMNARAARETSAAFIPREQLVTLLETHPEAKRLMLLALSENVEHVHRVTATLLGNSPRERRT